MQLSHYFLRNAGLVGGVSTEIDIVSNFSQIFEFDSKEKHHVYCRNVKFCIKTLFFRFSNKN